MVVATDRPHRERPRAGNSMVSQPRMNNRPEMAEKLMPLTTVFSQVPLVMAEISSFLVILARSAAVSWGMVGMFFRLAP